MKITVQCDALADAISVIKSTVPNRSTIPVLSCILFQQDAESLTLTATSMDVQTSVVIPSFSREQGAICLPAEILHGAVKGFSKSSTVTIERSGDDRAVVSSGKSRLSVGALNADDFPLMPALDEAVGFELDGLDLVRQLRTVAHAVSTVISRPTLCGIFWHVANGRLTAVGCDGTRLAKLSIPMPSGATTMPDVIVPAETCKLVTSIFDDVDTVSVQVSAQQISLLSDTGVTLRARLIDGQYPDYMAMISRHTGAAEIPPVTMSMYGESLTAAIQRACVVFTGLDKRRWFSLKYEGGETVSFRAVATNNDQSHEEADVSTAGGAFAFDANPDYLRDAANSWPIGGDEMQWHYIAPSKPILFTSGKDDGLLMLLMPRMAPAP